MFKKIFKHKIILFSLLLIVVIGIVLFFVYKQLNSSVSVDLTASSNNNGNNYNIDLTPKNISDKNIAFKYPKGLKLKSTTLAGQNSVDTYLFTAKDTYSWSLGIDVSTTPGAEISSLSSYKYRAENPSQYTLTNEVVNGMPIAIMTDTSFGGFSKVAYISNGKYVATISLIGEDTSGNSPLNTTFNMVINSWQWH